MSAKLPNSKSIIQDETEARLRRRVREGQAHFEQRQWELDQADKRLAYAQKWLQFDQNQLAEYLREQDQS